MSADPPELHERTALVTGGAGGIGAAICRDLAGLGAKVIVVDIDEARARAVADSLPNAESAAVDLCDPASVDRTMDDLSRRGVSVDILVNNAGVSRVQRFLESSPDTWDDMWRVNLRAPMQLTHGLLPGMVDREWGRLIYISTDGARAGAGGESVYATCKAGLFGLAKTLAREAARHGVTSNVVCPGLIDTPMLRSNQDEQPGVVDALLRTIPIRRAGRPEEVSGMVAYLCTDRASYITGQTLSVSGGITMA